VLYEKFVTFGQIQHLGNGTSYSYMEYYLSDIIYRKEPPSMTFNDLSIISASIQFELLIHVPSTVVFYLLTYLG